MVKKSSYRLGSRLRSSAKARRNYITYLMSGGNPKVKTERVITMLYAEQSPNGYIGYSSFEDDKFGDLKGPQPIPENPLLALMKLPGGGDYGVFGGNAVTRLKTVEIVVGDTSAKPGLADTLTYTAGNDRTAVFFAEDQLVMEPETEYPLTVRGIPAVRLTATMGAGGMFAASMGEIVAMGADAALGGALSARVCIEQRMKAAGDLGGAMRAHIYPPLTLQASPELGGEFSANLQITQTMRAVASLGGDLHGSMIPVVALVASMALEGAMRARIVPVVKLRGVMSAGGDLAGDIEAIPYNGPEFITATQFFNSVSNVNVIAPPEVEVGDLLLLTIACSGGPIVTPAGWTEVATIASGVRHQRLAYKIATGNDNVTVADAGARTAASMAVFRKATEAARVCTGIASTAGNTSPAWDTNAAYTADTPIVQTFLMAGALNSPSINGGSDFRDKTIVASLEAITSFGVATTVSFAGVSGTLTAPNLSWVGDTTDRTGQTFIIT